MHTQLLTRRQVLRPLRAFISVSCLLFAAAQAQPSGYLSHVASNPEATGGVARLLHYLPEDMPVAVYVPPAPAGAPGAAEAVREAFTAWQGAAPEIVGFSFVGTPEEASLVVEWLEEGATDTYRYTWTLEDGSYRFRAETVYLNPYRDTDLYRLALVQVGHALGLLGRSPFEGDAMSRNPSGVISERDLATLRALYRLPSGLALDPPLNGED